MGQSTRSRRSQRHRAPSAEVQNEPNQRLEIVPREAGSGPEPDLEFTVPGFSVHQVAVGSGVGYDYSWQGAEHYLALHDIQLSDGEIFCDSHASTSKTDLRNTLTFLPAGERVRGWSVPLQRVNSFTAAYFDPQQMDEDIARRFRHPLRTDVYFLNPSLQSTMAKLRRALQPDVERDPVYLESLGMLAVLEICQYQQHKSAPALPGAGRLSGSQMKSLTDYIEENLATGIGLTALAGRVGLSRFHFIRAFKRTTGQTPYQYLLHRRIDRARLLLGQPQLSVEQVARAVGFQNTSRFIRTFLRVTGLTPGALAAQNRNHKSL